MQCPYCVEEIDGHALACPHCGRDLYLFKPLLAKIESLERRLDALAELDALRSRVVQLEERLGRSPREAADASRASAASEPRPVAVSFAAAARPTAVCWLMPLGLLLATHAVVVLLYDLNTVYLRVLSLLIPLPFGYLLARDRRDPMPLLVVAAFAMAALAVLGMSAAVHVVDGTPVLPQDAREWRELVEYAASIGFSYLTGVALGRMVWRKRDGGKTAVQLRESVAKLISSGQANAETLRSVLSLLGDLGGWLAATAAAVASLLTGLRSFFGGS
jgi:hypothetical protein